MGRRYNFPLVVASLLCAASIAHGDILLESYVDQRPAGAERAAIERFKRALEARGVLTKPEEIVARIGSFLPQPGFSNRDVTRTQLLARIATGVKLSAHEAYDDAATTLVAVLQDVERNPALAASDPNSSTWITQARVALAFSYARTKRISLANEVVAEHIRCYPDISLKGVQEEVEKIYDQLQATLEHGPHGRLVFRVNVPEAEIFVSGVEQGIGKIEVNLVPSTYQIVIRVGVVYRSYKVAVTANETTTRTIDWPTDTSFVATLDMIGFVAPTQARANVAAFATELARSFHNEAILTVGIENRGSHRYLVANRFDAGTASRRPQRPIDVDGIGDPDIQSLATYMTAPVELVETLPSPSVDARPARWPVFVAAGTLSAAVPIGALFLRQNTNCYPNAPQTFPPCTPTDLRIGVAFMTVGGVALAFGVYWIVHADRSPPSSPISFDVQPARGGGLLSVRGQF